MRIYFNNKKYLSVNYCSINCKNGYQYLVFTIVDAKFSMQQLQEFFTKSNLASIIITNDNGIVLETFEDNLFQSVRKLQKDLNADGATITVILSSSPDGLETELVE